MRWPASVFSQPGEALFLPGMPISQWCCASKCERVASGENLMPPLVDAVKAMVSVGEISDVYREVFGVYTDPAWL